MSKDDLGSIIGEVSKRHEDKLVCSCNGCGVKNVIVIVASRNDFNRIGDHVYCGTCGKTGQIGVFDHDGVGVVWDKEDNPGTDGVTCDVCGMGYTWGTTEGPWHSLNCPLRSKEDA